MDIAQLNSEGAIPTFRPVIESWKVENDVETSRNRRSVAMVKLMMRIGTVILVIVLAVSIVGCHQKDSEKEKEREYQKAREVHIDAGPVKVNVENNRKPDENGRHVEVEVGRHPVQEHEAGDRDK